MIFSHFWLAGYPPTFSALSLFSKQNIIQEQLQFHLLQEGLHQSNIFYLVGHFTLEIYWPSCECLLTSVWNALRKFIHIRKLAVSFYCSLTYLINSLGPFGHRRPLPRGPHCCLFFAFFLTLPSWLCPQASLFQLSLVSSLVLPFSQLESSAWHHDLLVWQISPSWGCGQYSATCSSSPRSLRVILVLY